MSSTSSPPSDSGRRAAPLGRDFSLLWGASASANLADGLVRVALPLVAVELTRSPILVSGSRSPAPWPGSWWGCPPERSEIV
ncbi:hypothetical protein [Nocardiopsis alba]|uniref:hypothetical protein n=1 Tax=Nocardiopsis alba TaxID=53437 RepID=UPI001F39C189|nr:hypothetical protein [Nocardiopsis alba]